MICRGWFEKKLQNFQSQAQPMLVYRLLNLLLHIIQATKCNVSLLNAYQPQDNENFSFTQRH